MNTGPDPNRLRGRARRALKRYFDKKRSPRFVLGLVILLTGLVGFGLSYVMLRANMTSMALRYPLSILAAYAVFLGLIRIWVEIERHRFNPEDPELLEDLKSDEIEYEPLGTSQKDTSWYDWIDLPSGLDGDVGVLPLLLIAAIVGLVVLLISAIGGAPLLIAEIFIDAALAGLLYRHLRIPANEHWLGTAIRKTWLYVIGAAALMAIAGFCLDHLAPESDSLGKAIKELIQNF